jgi:secondary thiamine-phosphate synthase enzyme
MMETLAIETRGRGLTDITLQVRAVVAKSGIRAGLCSLFLRHTSASLVIQENADPAVLRDLERWLDKLAPESHDAYEHDAEGPDDMPAHLRSAVTRSSETLPVSGGALLLGTWQAIYLWEHRRAAHTREVVVSVLGE